MHSVIVENNAIRVEKDPYGIHFLDCNKTTKLLC